MNAMLVLTNINGMAKKTQGNNSYIFTCKFQKQSFSNAQQTILGRKVFENCLSVKARQEQKSIL